MFSDRYKNLTPYVAGEQPKDKKYIKLNTNENAYPPTPKVKKVLENFNINKLSLYPDPNFTKLRKSIAETYNLNAKNIFVGNGSDEILSFAFFTFFDNKNGKLLFPNYTYSFYPVYCDYYGIEFEIINLNDNYELNLDKYLVKNSCGVIFPNPNAPTSIALKNKSIEEFLSQYPKNRVVVIDEAYIDFAESDESSLDLIKKFKNLLIVRTFSKGFSLAGMRIGYALADEKLIKALFDTKDSFNSYPADMISQEVAKVAIEDIDYYKNINNKIIKTRDEFSNTLKELGWKVLPSSANFVFVSHPLISGSEIYQKLKEEGFLVRYFNKVRLKGFVRITIGTTEEMKVLIEAIKIF